MSGGIYLLQNNGQLVEMSEQAYDSEDLLQELLARYPHLLAGDQIDSASPRRWLLVMREAGVPGEEGAGGRWSVDHLFLDQDAIPTLVEVKRSTDTRIRREVVGQNLKTLVPRVIGQTATAEQKKRTTRQTRQWDEPSFFEELEARKGKEEVAVARKILDWARARVTRIWWGKGSTMGSFIPVFNHKGTDYQLFAVWTYGTVEVYFQWFTYKPPFDSQELRLDLLSRLNEIQGVSLSPEVITRRPGIPMTTLIPEVSLNRFLAVMDWFIEQAKAV